METLSLREYAGDQFHKLCQVVGLDNTGTVNHVLDDLLGPAGNRPLSVPPRWPSYVADDHTPLEFSLALDKHGDHAVRLLGETLGAQPSNKTNLHAAQRFLDTLTRQFPLALDRFRAIQDLFLPDEPVGLFVMWYSLVLRKSSAPSFKIYFNPDVQGPDQAPRLVEEGLNRLGLIGAYDTLAEYAFRGQEDRFVFFALDLHDKPRSRVKVYVTHEAAVAGDAAAAAGAVAGVDPEEIHTFCSLLRGDGPFDRRALISSYTFIEGDEARPSSYSLYLPIRDYVSDDEVAYERLHMLFARYRLDPTLLDNALAAVSRRPLNAGVGLVPWVSLRLDSARPGPTVYLSSEAYHVFPPRSAVLDGAHAVA